MSRTLILSRAIFAAATRKTDHEVSEPNEIQRKPHIPPSPGEDGKNDRERKPKNQVRDDRSGEANQTVSCVAIHNVPNCDCQPDLDWRERWTYLYSLLIDLPLYRIGACKPPNH